MQLGPSGVFRKSFIHSCFLIAIFIKNCPIDAWRHEIFGISSNAEESYHEHKTFHILYEQLIVVQSLFYFNVFQKYSEAQSTNHAKCTEQIVLDLFNGVWNKYGFVIRLLMVDWDVMYTNVLQVITYPPNVYSKKYRTVL